MARRDFQNKPSRYSEEEATNPSANDVLADTGELAIGIYTVALIAGANTNNSFIVQQRNAANAANVGDTWTVYVPGGSSAQYVFDVSLEASERIRVLSGSTITGKACAVLWVEKLS